MSTPYYGDPFAPKPATQEPREWQAETSLWDRLRADLNNLGAAYGPITEGVGESVVTPEPVERLADLINEPGFHWFGAEGLCVKCVRPPDEVALCLGTKLIRSAAIREARISMQRKKYAPKPTFSPADRNAYFDGIILAARMKRIRANHNDQCDRDIARNWDGWQAELDRSQMLEAAMSRPLDWEPRLGWKPGDCE